MILVVIVIASIAIVVIVIVVFVVLLLTFVKLTLIIVRGSLASSETYKPPSQVVISFIKLFLPHENFY